MRREYIQINKQEIRKDIRLHDTMLTKVLWNYQDRSASFELTDWEWGGEGRLSFEGAVYMEGSALGLWFTGVEYPIYINSFYVDTNYSVSDVFARCIEKSGSAPETCVLPDPDHYFCVAFGTNKGDLLQFVVSKVIWETDD